MLKTPLCEVLGIDVPIILAPMGMCTSAEFRAAVSKRMWTGGHRIAVPKHRRGEARHRHDQKARPFASKHRCGAARNVCSYKCSIR
jgi:NAD(P)H-dependent flavin oxidoreductase YrpB (nitropropane dioxygenase family)